MPEIAPPPVGEPAEPPPQSLVARVRERVRPLARFGAIAVGVAVLVVLVWLWHGRSEVPGAVARAAEPVPPPPPAGTARPVDQPEIVFNWKDAAGLAHRAAVAKDAYLAYLETVRAAAERDRQSAATAASQSLADQLAPVFDQMQTRVSRYADWAFDWWTSWILLGRAFGWSWDNLRQGHVRTLPDRVQEQLTATIQQRFRDLALQPDVTDPQLAVIVERSTEAADAALSGDCAESQVALADFVRRAARRAERRDPPLGWLPDSGWNPADATFQPACPPHPLRTLSPTDVRATLSVADASGPVEEVILRLARPFATKLISFILLPGIVAAVVGGFVLPLFGLLPNIISGVITGILTGAFGAIIIGFAASASVDMLLNRTDEALNRPQFEASARKAVIAVQAGFETRVIAAQQHAIDEALKTRLAVLAGEPPKR